MQITQSIQSKSCFKCGSFKSLDCFYKHPGMKDGRLNKCKDCTKRDTKENRSNKLEYYQEYDRARGSLEKRVEARKAYAKTERGKEAFKRGHKKYCWQHSLRRKAHVMVHNYIRDGKLFRPTSCSQCKKDCKPHAHHCDYTKPVDVMWLCKDCHLEWHKNNRPLYGEEAHQPTIPF